MVEQFCKSILELGMRNSKGLTNLVMGLASQKNARSAVEVSLSPCYHYQYSSISKAISGLDDNLKRLGGLKGEKLSRLEVEKKFITEGRLF